MTKLSDDEITIRMGRRLREIRKASGVSGTGLAHSLGIAHQQLYKYERGINTMSAVKLYRLAYVLGISVADLFEGLPATEMRAEIAP